MKRFDDTELWEVLDTYDKSPALATMKLDDILDKFLAEIHSYCRVDKNIAERILSLNYLRSKLAAYLEERNRTSKKFRVLRMIIRRALASIDSELYLIEMDLEHPERFIEFPSDHPPLARWNGKIIELIEYHLPLQISGKLLLPSGAPMSYTALVRFLESSYGITIADERIRKSEVVNRAKPTVFIEKMLNVLKESIKKSHQ
jgi:hypothetical protein